MDASIDNVDGHIVKAVRANLDSLVVLTCSAANISLQGVFQLCRF